METRAAILCAVICAAGLFTAAAQDVPRLDRTGLQPYDLDLWLRCRVEHFGHEEELLLRTNSADAHLVYRLFDADKGRRFLGERSRTLQSWRGDTLWRIPVEAPLERFVLEVSLTDRASGRTVRDVLEIDRRRDDPGWYALADFNGRSVLPANAPVGMWGSCSVRPRGMIFVQRSHSKVREVSCMCECTEAHARCTEVGQRRQFIIAWP